MLHWDGDTFDPPDGAELLASTEICANQAFSLGRHACQFRPKISGMGFQRWLVEHAVEIAATRGISAAVLRGDTESLARDSAERGAAGLSEWLAGLYSGPE